MSLKLSYPEKTNLYLTNLNNKSKIEVLIPDGVLKCNESNENLRLPGAARNHNMREHESTIWRAHACSGALPLGIEPIVVLHQDGSCGCRWMGSRCKQRAP
jgi:hypothetical protein